MRALIPLSVFRSGTELNVLLTLEQACRRHNEASLISRGLFRLMRQMDAFTVDAVLAAPKKLFRTAKALGGVSVPARASGSFSNARQKRSSASIQ